MLIQCTRKQPNKSTNACHGRNQRQVIVSFILVEVELVISRRYNALDNLKYANDNNNRLVEYIYCLDATIKSLRNGNLHTEYAYD